MSNTKRYLTGAGTARISDMSLKKHELILIIITALVFAASTVQAYIRERPEPLFESGFNQTDSQTDIPSISFENNVTYQNETGGDQSGFVVNINNAGIEELKLLDGIGDVKAQAIIDYRKNNGLFVSVEELLQVEGIGEKTLARFIDNVTV